MRRWSSIAAFSLILIALPGWAQRHGGGGAHFSSGTVSSSRGFAPHSSGSFHSSSSFRAAGMNHGPNVYMHGGKSFHDHHNFYRNRFYSSYYPYYPYAAYYPYFSYDGLYSNFANDRGEYEPDQSYASYTQPTPYREDSGLKQEVESLNGKIDRLQAEIEARNHSTPEPATALVFRDQHVEEVRNYAISGGTLWVLNEQAAKKIPLAQLDLPATVHMNEDRGVDFQVPTM